MNITVYNKSCEEIHYTDGRVETTTLCDKITYTEQEFKRLMTKGFSVDSHFAPGLYIERDIELDEDIADIVFEFAIYEDEKLTRKIRSWRGSLVQSLVKARAHSFEYGNLAEYPLLPIEKGQIQSTRKK